MRKVHGHEYGGHDAEKEAAHDEEEDEVRKVELTADDNIVWVPYVVHCRVTVVGDGSCSLVNDAGNPCTKTEIKYAGEAVDLCRDNTDYLIS